MKTLRRKEKSEIKKVQQYIKIKSRIINTMVFSIMYFIAILLLCNIVELLS